MRLPFAALLGQSPKLRHSLLEKPPLLGVRRRQNLSQISILLLIAPPTLVDEALTFLAGQIRPWLQTNHFRNIDEN
jgi:hypothetical protein